MRGFIILAFLLVAATTPVQAEIVAGYSCGYYFPDSETAPPEVRELLEKVSPGAIKSCSVWGDPETRTYDFVSVPLHHPFGVCQVTMRRLFHEDGNWTHTPPADKPYLGDRSVSMMVAEGDCPRQDDPRYVITNDISPGVFLAAVRVWERLSSASGPDALADVTFPSARAGQIFRDFESEFGLWKSFKLVGVSLSSAAAHSPAYYHLDLEGSPTNWTLLFDFMDEEPVVVGIGTFVY
ncbi:hypothetical protein ACKGJN_16265, partial [Gillisia sp. Q332]|uniref:hypothetical protein n=1 Tax=Pseudomonadati TaxID=3379134 RepID=UPI0030ED8FF2